MPPSSPSRRPGPPRSAPVAHSAAPRRSDPAPQARRDLVPVLFLPCAAGVEPWLLEEVQSLMGDTGARPVEARGGVLVQLPLSTRLPADLAPDLGGDAVRVLIEAVFVLNLRARLPQRVLWRVALAPCANEDQLYQLARGLPWSDWITPRHTLRVDVTARHSPLTSLKFAGLRIKDGVCDQLRDIHGERPDVDIRHPDLSLLLHLDGEVAHLYVDTSGEALFKRGWREDKGEAPLKETLAAAMLAAAGWKGRAEDGPLLDPCCGSGTIAIEAAQIACGIAPGLLRRFAFERLRPFQPQLPRWQQLRQQARTSVHPPAVKIFAGDVAFRMTDFAARNAERAGVSHAIEFKTADALQRPCPAPSGTMMFNPPYGERIAPKGTGHGRSAREDFVEQDAGDFFTRLSAHWKRNFPGWTAWVLSPDMKLPSAMRLKESRRIVMYNGPIECRLFRFDLVAGSHKQERPVQP